MKMRELPGVLRCRPRGRDALGGPVSESAAFFRLVPLGGDLESWCLHASTDVLLGTRHVLRG